MVVFYNDITFAMQENIEQRYSIKFCVKLHKSATETFASLTKAYRDATLPRRFFKWHKAFKEGRENVEDDPRSGRPISSTNDQNVEVVRAVMAKDSRLSVRMIAEETDLDKNAVYRILTDNPRTHKQYSERHKTSTATNTTTQKLGRVRAVPRLCGFYPGICLTTEEKASKNLILTKQVTSGKGPLNIQQGISYAGYNNHFYKISGSAGR